MTVLLVGSLDLWISVLNHSVLAMVVSQFDSDCEYNPKYFKTE